MGIKNVTNERAKVIVLLFAVSSVMKLVHKRIPNNI